MISNPTAKARFNRHLIVATAIIGLAWTNNAYADEVARNTAAEQSASLQSTASARVERSFDLRDYGDRFKLAIEAIRKEAEMPDWTWEDSGEDARVTPKN